METRITKLLGIEKPIIQGAMAWIANASLASAVSDAGGLGIIACGSAPVSWVCDQIHEVRAKTDKPFACNIMLLNPEAPDLAQLMVDEHVEVVTTGAGTPAPYMEMWKNAGIKVLPVIASTAMAKKMERTGADAIIAEGQEAGGHIGELTTMALTPAVCDAVSIPVATAGGVADGRGMVAAFALGAEGVQIGTRFLTAKECTVSEPYKQKILDAGDADTIVTGRYGGHPVRQLKNTFSREAKKLEAGASSGDQKSIAELEGMLAGSLKRAAIDGDVKNGSVMAGQVAALVHDEKTALQIIDDILAEAEQWGAKNLQQMADANAAHAWKTA